MKKKGFITLYLLPIFLSITIVSGEVLKSVTTSYHLTNNYFGKVSAKYLSEIGLKHGINFSRENLSNKEYYINLIDNEISMNSELNGNEYTKVKIATQHSHEEIIVNIESRSNVSNYSHTLNYKYSIYIGGEEKDVDNSLENLDTNENRNLT